MDLGEYSLELLFLGAIKSEKRASEIYSGLSEIAEDGSSKKTLMSLSKEEKKHERILRGMFKEIFPDETIILPKTTIVPLPNFSAIKDIDSPHRVIEIAIKHEEASSEYYRKFAERFDEKTKMRKTLIYLSHMEMEHREKLQSQLELSDDIDRFLKNFG